MNRRRRCRRVADVVTATFVVACFAGCGTGVPTAEVTGRITFDGASQAGVLVEFTPLEMVAGKHRPSAYGITDAQGRYRAFRTGRNLFGVVIGRNAVRLSAMEGSDAKVHPGYSKAPRLTCEVVSGSNVYDLDLPSDPSLIQRSEASPDARRP